MKVTNAMIKAGMAMAMRKPGVKFIYTDEVQDIFTAMWSAHEREEADKQKQAMEDMEEKLKAIGTAMAKAAREVERLTIAFADAMEQREKKGQRPVVETADNFSYHCMMCGARFNDLLAHSCKKD